MNHFLFGECANLLLDSYDKQENSVGRFCYLLADLVVVGSAQSALRQNNKGLSSDVIESWLRRMPEGRSFADPAERK